MAIRNGWAFRLMGLEFRPSQNVPGDHRAMVPNLLSLSLSLYPLARSRRLLSSLYRGDTVPISTSITVILLLVTEAIYISWSVARASVALKEPRSDRTNQPNPLHLFFSVDISNTNSLVAGRKAFRED